MSKDWSQHIRIPRDWTTAQLINHFNEIDKKLAVRLYTVKVTGTTIRIDGLSDALHEMLPHYVYGEVDIAKMGEMLAGLKANRFFGKKDPVTDGKYGELLLFALVEDVLRCKMVAHKIRSLSNYRDQVKGGDGIFLGDYNVDGQNKPAYLIGESKIEIHFSTALTNALESINRFHEDISEGDFFGNELVVAKDNIRFDTDLDDLYDRLTPTEQKFKDQILVHPILLMYNYNMFESFENLAKDSAELEMLINNKMIARKIGHLKLIAEKLKNYKELGKVYLDFFLIPTRDVKKFRHLMYEKVHGVPYI